VTERATGLSDRLYPAQNQPKFRELAADQRMVLKSLIGLTGWIK
jgi:hypothetical protein